MFSSALLRTLLPPTPPKPMAATFSFAFGETAGVAALSQGRARAKPAAMPV